MSIDSLLKKYGAPVLVADDYEFKTEDNGVRSVVLYGVDKEAESFASYPRGSCLIWTSDKRFKQHVGYHFDDMKDLGRYMGWTMYGSRSPSGSSFTILTTNLSGETEVVSFDDIHVVYLEVGPKGNLIRVKPR